MTRCRTFWPPRNSSSIAWCWLAASFNFIQAESLLNSSQNINKPLAYKSAEPEYDPSLSLVQCRFHWSLCSDPLAHSRRDGSARLLNCRWLHSKWLLVQPLILCHLYCYLSHSDISILNWHQSGEEKRRGVDAEEDEHHPIITLFS